MDDGLTIGRLAFPAAERIGSWLPFGRHRPLDEPVAEAAGPAGAKGSLSALKRDDLAKAAEQKLKGTGWLPAILRAA